MQDMINLIYDKEFRQKLTSNPRQYVSQLDLTVSTDVEIIVKTNTKNIMYIPIPTASIQETDMADIAAAVKASTAASVGSAGTVSSICATVATASSVSSVGSVISS